MGRVMKLLDDKSEILFGERDFEYLIDKYMGYEAVQYFRELMNNVYENKRKEVLGKFIGSHDYCFEEGVDVISNKNIGNRFEAEFCDILYQNGYWVHNIAQNRNGQPADVIAVKNGVVYLIDCKVCSKGKFPFWRIEENQDFAMTLWEKCGNGQGWFALLLKDKIYMFPYTVIDYYRERQNGFNEQDIKKGIPIELWMKGVKP